MPSRWANVSAAAGAIEVVSRRDAFLSACPSEFRTGLRERDDLEEVLESILREAEQAWPAIDLPESGFLAFVAQRLREDSADPLAELRVADLFLAHACARGQPEALAAFERALFGEVDVLARRVSGRLDIDEVKQQLRCRLFLSENDGPPRIAAYSGAGELRNWFRVAATRLALNRVRDGKLPYQPADDVLLEELAPMVEGPELEPYKVRYAAAFKSAFERALADIDVRDRLLLRYQIADGLRVEDIARVFDVHRSSAARWLAAARKQLLAKTRQHLAQTLRLHDAELQAVIDLVISRVEVTLSRLAD